MKEIKAYVRRCCVNKLVTALDSSPTGWISRVLLVLFLIITAFFLWTEHRAHLLGALPWILLIACCALLFIGLHDVHKHPADSDEAHRRAS